LPLLAPRISRPFAYVNSNEADQFNVTIVNITVYDVRRKDAGIGDSQGVKE